MLQGMKLIKLYGWEEIFCDVITSVRNREIKKLMWAVVLYCVSSTFLVFIKHFHQNSLRIRTGLYNDVYVLGTFPISVKTKIQRQITWVGFKPMTFASPEQMSYH